MHARDLPWRMAPTRFAKGQRPDPYKVWLSEIMLQQTTVATVKSYFDKFSTLWPTLEDLAAAPRDDILAAWAGLGYYSRARNIHKCAQVLRDEHGGKFPQSAAELLTLPGIGPYTSAAISAICFDEPVAVIDGNVERVFARLYALQQPPATIKKEMRALVQTHVPDHVPDHLPGQFAEATMDLGATICSPSKPKCDLCPINHACRAFAEDAAAEFPKKLPKKTRPERVGHAYVVARPDQKVWLQKRGETGLLAGMDEVPGSDWREGEVPEFAPPLKGDWREAGTIVHIFTHFRLTLNVHIIQINQSVKDDFEDGKWVASEDFDRVALPTVMKKVLTRALSEN